MNPINKGSTVTLSNGNLDQVTASGGWNSARASIAVASGKWYWEVTITGTSQLVMHGVDDNTYNVTTNPSSAYVGAYTNSWGVYASNGQKRNNTGSGTAYGSAFAQNDVMIVAMDMDSGKIWWGKNGTWFASGDPVAGTNAAYTNLSGYTLNPATSGFDTTDSCTHNFGQRPFAYTAPTGFKALCTQNLPTPAIGGSSETLASKFFNTITYSGNGTQSITGVGFRPDLVWIKSRSNGAYNHQWHDVVRGATAGALFSNTTTSENATYQFDSFDSDGFTTDSSNITGVNNSGQTFVAWNWRAGNSAGSRNTAGSIASNVSANPTSGFSIVTYSGNSSQPSTVGHGLAVAPSFYFIKERNGSTYDWNGYHVGLGNTLYIALNTTAAASSAVSAWNNTSPTSSVFTINHAAINSSGVNYVAYCFAAVAGYSAFGSYIGNGSTDGPFMFTGFRPAYVLIKRSSTSGNHWQILDTKRSTYNVMADYMYAGATQAEAYDATVGIDSLSNGFKLRGTDGNVNAVNSTYIYMAFAESPFKYSLAR
jgi:hypothetical protein